MLLQIPINKFKSSIILHKTTNIKTLTNVLTPYYFKTKSNKQQKPELDNDKRIITPCYFKTALGDG